MKRTLVLLIISYRKFPTSWSGASTSVFPLSHLVCVEILPRALMLP